MKYFITTFGCQMNVHESEKLAGALENLGAFPCEKIEDADIIVFNTCAIREGAEDRAIGNIGALKKLKREHPEKIIAVCGCMTQQKEESEKLYKTFPFIDIIFGTKNLEKFENFIKDIMKCRQANKKKRINEIEENDYIIENLPIARTSGKNFWVNIIYGCNNFCSYCIVPYVRGREISRPVNEILNELDVLSKMGVLEICLIGQNVNSYHGKIKNPSFNNQSENSNNKNPSTSSDFTNEVQNPDDVTFAELLQLIANHLKKTNSSIKWVRFMSSHPKDLTDDVIDVIAREKVLCRHIHLPVQHGSNAILQKMNRRYTREHYLALVEKIKSKIPEVSLTTDIMMGFPGETEQDVLDTLDLMEKVCYESAMMYFYNPREGTPAAKMEQLPVEVRKERLQRVIDLQLEHTHRQMSARVGKIVQVLVEGVSRDDKTELLGQTEQHEKVAFKAEKSCIGHFVNVKLTELSGNTFRGELWS